MSYCAERHELGWFCILRKGHQGDHLSLDNTRIWKGSPGAPVEWEAELPRELTDELDPTLTTGEASKARALVEARAKGYTGQPCALCGSPNTVRIGTCLRCDSCGSAGECG